MAGTFQVGGLVSGIDTNLIIERLMQLERRPILRLQKQKDQLQKRADTLRDVRTRLETLQSKLFPLTLSSTFRGRLATAADAKIAGATATSDAIPGSFTLTVDQLATSTVARSTGAIGRAVDAGVALANAGFATAPTTGTFSINGVAITIDTATVLSGDTNADGLVDGAGDNSIISLINNSGAGVTAGLVNDATGRPNLIELTSVASVQLGSGADTSNFLSAARLLSSTESVSGGTFTRRSTGNLGVVQPSPVLTSARLATSLSASQGSFKINGVEVTYDATVDSLGAVIDRINRSTAGVTASYDAVQDKVVLAAKATGSTAIALEDVAGNFLAATNVLSTYTGGTQEYGQNALFRIDTVAGGAQQTSAGNTVTGALTGVTLELKAPGSTTVTIAPDVASATSALKAFVEQHNSVMDFIRQQTAYDATTKKGGVLLGDPFTFGVVVTLRTVTASETTALAGSLHSLADVGVTTGAIGSAPGTANTLSLDETKLASALRENAANVEALVADIAGRLNTYVKGVIAFEGPFRSGQVEVDREVQALASRMRLIEERLKDREAGLIQRFTRLERTLASLRTQSSALQGQLGRLASL